MISNTSEVAIATNGDLILTLNSKDDGGEYTCEAINEVAMATSSVAITVHVHPSTSVTMETVTTLLGQTAELECVATGNPPPIVTWYKDTRVLTDLDERVSLLGGLLRIAIVTVDDEGVYTCTAVNSVGIASSDVQLIVYGEGEGLCSGGEGLCSGRGRGCAVGGGAMQWGGGAVQWEGEGLCSGGRGCAVGGRGCAW